MTELDLGSFSSVKNELPIPELIFKSGNRTLGANYKKTFFAKFLGFVSFLALFHKNIKNAYFDQHLRCAAPKRWSKYTTSTYF